MSAGSPNTSSIIDDSRNGFVPSAHERPDLEVSCTHSIEVRRLSRSRYYLVHGSPPDRYRTDHLRGEGRPHGRRST